MFVRELVRMAHNDEYISIEDEDFNVFVDGDARNVLSNNIILGLKVDYFYTGNRNNHACTVIVASK